MKKSLIALAAVAASGAAFAQSSVTLYGVADAGVTYVDGATNWSGLTTGDNASSRLGFRGVEDLGNGLKASFVLEGGLSVDTGSGLGGKEAGEPSGQGFEFKRQATIGLQGGFGEIRMGRELTAAYRATSRYDVFGNVGIAQSRLWANEGFGGVQSSAQRVNNAVTYISPDFSGFKVSANYAFGEANDNNTNAYSSSANRYYGAGLTYDNGPLSLGLAAERQNSGNQGAAGLLGFTGDVKAWSLGASYNFGVAKLSAAYRDSESKNGSVKDDLSGYYVGVSAPVGAAGELKVSYNRYNAQMDSADKLKADQFAVGYVHNLSKRTAVYGTYAYLKNKEKNGANLGLALNSTAGLDDGKQHGVTVGLRHSF